MTKIWRNIALLSLVSSVFAVAGCASTPDDYAGQPGAATALAQCQEKSDTLPVTQQAATNPFFVAAMQQQYVNDCMAAKGYRH